MAPRDAPNDPRVSILLFFEEREVKGIRFPLVEGPLTVTRARQKELVTLGELKLHDCQLVSLQTARRYRCLSLCQIPNNDVGVLSLLRLASTRGDVTLVTGGDRENLEDMPIKFLLLRPEGASHQDVLYGWLLNSDHF